MSVSVLLSGKLKDGLIDQFGGGGAACERAARERAARLAQGPELSPSMNYFIASLRFAAFF